MLQVEPSNIFKSRNDWNIIAAGCKKHVNGDGFISAVANIIKQEYEINPFTETKYRGRRQVMARQLLAVMLYNYTCKTLENIGDVIRKDHATVLHSIATIKDLCDTDKRFKALFDRINEKVKKLKQ